MITADSIPKYLREILAALDDEPLERIILFGSAASGQLGPDSDLDLLIVTDTDYLPKTYQERMEYRLRIQRRVRSIADYARHELVHERRA